MCPGLLRIHVFGIALSISLLLVGASTSAQSTTSIEGQVVNQNGAVVSGKVMKPTNLGERVRVRFRAEVFDLFNFDLFNHANFGRPGNIAGTPSFGRITSTRFPTSESASSRQIQFALEVITDRTRRNETT